VQKNRDEDYLKKFGNKVRELREELKLSQMELGVRCNNHGEQIGRIERGEQNPTICTAKELAKGLEVRVSVLTDLD